MRAISGWRLWPSRVIGAVFWSLVLATSVAVGARADDVANVSVSADHAVVLGGITLRDDEVAVDDLLGGAVVVLSALPPAVDLDAFHDLGAGTVLFSVDIPTVLGGTVFLPADIVRFDGALFTKRLDAAAAGVPAGADVDALAADGQHLLLSFDGSVALPGVGARDHDLVRWNGSSFTLAFDGAAAGIAAALDVDAVHLQADGHLLLSFDTGGVVGGVVFADDDVLHHDPVAGLWQPAYDGSTLHGDWVRADLDAVSAAEGSPKGVPPPGPAGALRFSMAIYTVPEDGMVATIVVERIGGSVGAVAVNFTTADGSAFAGSDYDTAAGVLSWPSGDAAPRTFAVPILDDAVPEGSETVHLVLSNPTGGAVLADPDTALLVITDGGVVPEIPTLNGTVLLALGLLLAAAGVLALAAEGKGAQKP